MKSIIWIFTLDKSSFRELSGGLYQHGVPLRAWGMFSKMEGWGGLLKIFSSGVISMNTFKRQESVFSKWGTSVEHVRPVHTQQHSEKSEKLPNTPNLRHKGKKNSFGPDPDFLQLNNEIKISTFVYYAPASRSSVSVKITSPAFSKRSRNFRSPLNAYSHPISSKNYSHLFANSRVRQSN